MTEREPEALGLPELDLESVRRRIERAEDLLTELLSAVPGDMTVSDERWRRAIEEGRAYLGNLQRGRLRRGEEPVLTPGVLQRLLRPQIGRTVELEVGVHGRDQRRRVRGRALEVGTEAVEIWVGGNVERIPYADVRGARRAPA